MNKEQLIRQLRTNNDLIGRHNEQAYDHLLMLKNDYVHLIDEEVELLIELNSSLALQHFKSDYNGSLDNSLSVVSRFANSRYKHLLALHQRMIGHVYIEKAEYLQAEKYLFMALGNIQPGSPDYESNRAQVLHTLAMMHEYKEDGPEKPVAYLTEAITLLSAADHATRMATCQLGLGNIYNEAGQVEEALRHYLAAAAIFEEKYLLTNMAAAYCNIGNCYIKLVDFNLAEKYLNKSLELRFKIGTPFNISISSYNLGILYKERGELSRAEEMFAQAKQQAEISDNIQFLGMIEDEFADLRRRQTQYTLNA